jgi:hypothetical protein
MVGDTIVEQTAALGVEVLLAETVIVELPMDIGAETLVELSDEPLIEVAELAADRDDTVKEEVLAVLAELAEGVDET